MALQLDLQGSGLGTFSVFSGKIDTSTYSWKKSQGLCFKIHLLQFMTVHPGSESIQAKLKSNYN